MQYKHSTITESSRDARVDFYVKFAFQGDVRVFSYLNKRTLSRTCPRVSSRSCRMMLSVAGRDRSATPLPLFWEELTSASVHRITSKHSVGTNSSNQQQVQEQKLPSRHGTASLSSICTTETTLSSAPSRRSRTSPPPLPPVIAARPPVSHYKNINPPTHSYTRAKLPPTMPPRTAHSTAKLCWFFFLFIVGIGGICALLLIVPYKISAMSHNHKLPPAHGTAGHPLLHVREGYHQRGRHWGSGWTECACGPPPKRWLSGGDRKELYMVDCLGECKEFWNEIGNGWAEWLAKVDEV